MMPAAFNALADRGAHVLTFNDYLAGRDAEWMGPIYRLLGLSVGCVQQEWRRPTGARPITRTSPTSPRKRPASITCATCWRWRLPIWCTVRFTSRSSMKPIR